MIKKSLLLVIIVSLSLALFPAHAVASYVPHQGDYFSYYDIINLTNSTGAFYGYTEHETVNGNERMNQAFGNGTVASNYTYTWNWSNSSGSTQNGKSAGNFTWSWTSFQYVKGNDSQTGYKPLYVWFYIDNTTQQSGTFRLLNTPMTVTSTSYSYYLSSQNSYVKAIRAQGSGGYQRNYGGLFNAAYTYTTYSDPSTGYIIGYDYVEQDTSSTASFTWTETLYVTTTSYPLTTVPPPPSNSGSQYLYLIVGLAFFIVIIVIIVIVAVALSRRRRRIPQHTYPQVPVAPPTIDLTPKQQPPVQQVVIKEVVKVKCRYCGALIDSTVQACPFCGAPRT
jgi:hypothetical protein